MVQLMPLTPRHLLLHENPDWFNLSVAGLRRLSLMPLLHVCEAVRHRPRDRTVARSIQFAQLLKTSGYATWFAAGGAIRIAHYDVICNVITQKL